MKVRITIIIAVCSGSQTIEKTLSSLAECVLPKSLSRVLVVENGPSASLEAKVRSFERQLPILYRYTPNIGKSTALNWGIQNDVADDEFIIFTDDDVRFNKFWICRYEEMFLKYGIGYFYGGSFGVEYDVPPPPFLFRRLPGSAQGRGDSVFAYNERKNFVGFNWAVNRRDLMSVGLFNHQYGPGSTTGATGQETEMQVRLREYGIRRVFIPENPVWHYVPKDKCSFKWIRSRAKRVGIEGYLNSPKKMLWLRNKLHSILRSTLLLGIGRKEEFYKLVTESIEFWGFLTSYAKRCDHGQRKGKQAK